MAQSSPHAAIIPTESLVAILPTESSVFVAMLPFEMAIAMTGRLLALTTETQEAEVRSCKESWFQGYLKGCHSDLDSIAVSLFVNRETTMLSTLTVRQEKENQSE